MPIIVHSVAAIAQLLCAGAMRVAGDVQPAFRVKQTDENWLAMQVVYKPFMAAMLADIANATAPAPPGAWITRIMDALPKDNLDAGGDC